MAILRAKLQVGGKPARRGQSEEEGCCDTTLGSQAFPKRNRPGERRARSLCVGVGQELTDGWRWDKRDAGVGVWVRAGKGVEVRLEKPQDLGVHISR